MNKYNREDLIPITIVVLQIMGHAYLCNAFKIVVQREYPEFKGVIATDSLDRFCVQLVDDTKEPSVLIARRSIHEIFRTLFSLANIYSIAIDPMEDRERLQDLAAVLYQQIVVDGFPYDGEAAQSLKSYNDHLSFFALSAVVMVSSLCRLVADSRLDAERAWDPDPLYLDILLKDYSGNENCTALGLLQKLGDTLDSHHVDLVCLEYKI